jgi:hypothetical protein
VLALALPLLARRYPGERALLSLRRASRRRARWPRARSTMPVRRAPLPVVVRGARLIGSSLAVRPPPATLTAS